jgi:hypothetical protein
MPTSSLRDEIAGNVRAELARAGEGTTVALGRILGLSQAAAARRMRGAAPFTTDDLVVIADHLGISVDSLIHGRVAS